MARARVDNVNTSCVWLLKRKYRARRSRWHSNESPVQPNCNRRFKMHENTGKPAFRWIGRRPVFTVLSPTVTQLYHDLLAPRKLSPPPSPPCVIYAVILSRVELPTSIDTFKVVVFPADDYTRTRHPARSYRFRAASALAPPAVTCSSLSVCVPLAGV